MALGLSKLDAICAKLKGETTPSLSPASSPTEPNNNESESPQFFTKKRPADDSPTETPGKKSRRKSAVPKNIQQVEDEQEELDLSFQSARHDESNDEYPAKYSRDDISDDVTDDNTFVETQLDDEKLEFRRGQSDDERHNSPSPEHGRQGSPSYRHEGEAQNLFYAQGHESIEVQRGMIQGYLSRVQGHSNVEIDTQHEVVQGQLLLKGQGHSAIQGQVLSETQVDVDDSQIQRLYQTQGSIRERTDKVDKPTDENDGFYNIESNKRNYEDMECDAAENASETSWNSDETATKNTERNDNDRPLSSSNNNTFDDYGVLDLSSKPVPINDDRAALSSSDENDDDIFDDSRSNDDESIVTEKQMPKMTSPPNSELKEYAMNTMNELLSMYGMSDAARKVNPAKQSAERKEEDISEASKMAIEQRLKATVAQNVSRVMMMGNHSKEIPPLLNAPEPNMKIPEEGASFLHNKATFNRARIPDYSKYIKKFYSSEQCNSQHCQDFSYREHYHCIDCNFKVFVRKEEMIRHFKWHKKRDDSLQHGFMRFSPIDDCSGKYGQCTHNGRQTHYHCMQLGCDKVYISTSDVQMHANYHRKDSAIIQEGFQRFRATEDCGTLTCTFYGQRTTHFHCRRTTCKFTFKNKADMEKHKSYHQKDEMLGRDGFKKFMKYEHCSYLACRYSKTSNHIHCIRPGCDYVLHSTGQLYSHKRKHERHDFETAYRKFKDIKGKGPAPPKPPPTATHIPTNTNTPRVGPRPILPAGPQGPPGPSAIKIPIIHPDAIQSVRSALLASKQSLPLYITPSHLSEFSAKNIKTDTKHTINPGTFPSTSGMLPIKTGILPPNPGMMPINLGDIPLISGAMPTPKISHPMKMENPASMNVEKPDTPSTENPRTPNLQIKEEDSNTDTDNECYSPMEVADDINANRTKPSSFPDISGDKLNDSLTLPIPEYSEKHLSSGQSSPSDETPPWVKKTRRERKTRDDTWKHYLIRYTANDPCSSRCALLYKDHYHCRVAGCTCLFKSKDAVREHARYHELEAKITALAYNLYPADKACPHTACEHSEKRIHYHCSLPGCHEPFTDAHPQFTRLEHYKSHDVVRYRNPKFSTTSGITKDLVKRPRGRPPKYPKFDIPNVPKVTLTDEEISTSASTEGDNPSVVNGFKVFQDEETCPDELCMFYQKKHYHCARPRCHYVTASEDILNLHSKEFHMFVRILEGFEFFDRNVNCRRPQCMNNKSNRHFHCLRPRCDYSFVRNSTMLQHDKKHREHEAIPEETPSSTSQEKLPEVKSDHNANYVPPDEKPAAPLSLNLLPGTSIPLPLNIPPNILSSPLSNPLLLGFGWPFGFPLPSPLGPPSTTTQLTSPSPLTSPFLPMFLPQSAPTLPQTVGGVSGLNLAYLLQHNPLSQLPPFDWNAITAQMFFRDDQNCLRPFCKMKQKDHYHCLSCDQGVPDLERLNIHLSVKHGLSKPDSSAEGPRSWHQPEPVKTVSEESLDSSVGKNSDEEDDNSLPEDLSVKPNVLSPKSTAFSLVNILKKDDERRSERGDDTLSFYKSTEQHSAFDLTKKSSDTKHFRAWEEKPSETKTHMTHRRTPSEQDYAIPTVSPTIPYKKELMSPPINYKSSAYSFDNYNSHSYNTYLQTPEKTNAEKSLENIRDLSLVHPHSYNAFLVTPEKRNTEKPAESPRDLSPVQPDDVVTPTGFRRYRYFENCKFDDCQLRCSVSHFHCLIENCDEGFSNRVKAIEHSQVHKKHTSGDITSLVNQKSAFSMPRDIKSANDEENTELSTDTIMNPHLNKSQQILDNLSVTNCMDVDCSHKSSEQTHYHCSRDDCSDVVVSLSEMRTHQMKHSKQPFVKSLGLQEK